MQFQDTTPQQPLPAQPSWVVRQPRVLGAAPGASSAGDYHARYSRLIPDLRPGEMVIVVLRRHVSVVLMQLALPLALLGAWTFGLFFALPLIQSLQTDPLLAGGFQGPTSPSWVPVTLTAIYMLLAGLLVFWALYIYLDWKDDWLALTTRRLVMMDKTLIFHETRREVPVLKIQNIVAEYPRLLSMYLDFGDLSIDTAGVGVMVFKDLPHPREMREVIFLQQAALESSQAPPEDRRKAALRNLLHGADHDTHNSPTPPNGHAQIPGRGETQLIDYSSVSGLGLLSRFFPLAPQRNGKGVTWHRHWVFLLRGLLWPALLYAGALIGWFVLRVSGALDPLDEVLGWAAVLLLPVCLVWAVWRWEDWRNDLYRLDAERVYHVESLPFGLREESTETLVSRITDVSYSLPGPLAHLLNYGDVIIKTPGESTEILFKGIPRPREVQGEIMARVDEHRLKAQAGMDGEIEAWIKAYDDVRRGK
ncbi:MAG: PH domain-containing protein [Chloroflexota bacterium]|nr:PH domain-containing protein [Chloroflexota bacterium]